MTKESFTMHAVMCQKHVWLPWAGFEKEAIRGMRIKVKEGNWATLSLLQTHLRCVNVCGL